MLVLQVELGCEFHCISPRSLPFHLCFPKMVGEWLKLLFLYTLHHADLTQTCLVDISILANWTSPFVNYRVSGSFEPSREITVLSIDSFFKCACAAIQLEPRCLIFGWTLRLLPYFMCANSELRRLWRDCADAQARLSLRWLPV